MGKTFVGQRVSKLETGRPPEPVSRVTLVVDGENAYTAGDDTGRTVEKTVPWATQAMADAVLQNLRGVAYQPFEGLDAVLDPAAEIGDGVTVAGVYSTLARADVTFDGLYTSDIAAPGGDEVEDEYPYQSRSQRQAQRELAKIRSSITKTAERITLLVENEIEGLSGKLELTASSLTAEINNTRDGLNSKLELTASNFQVQINGLNNAYSSISQTVDSIGFGVYNGSDSSTITMYKNGIAVSSQNIYFTGMVTFNDLSGNRGTIIDGGAINTNTLKLNSLYGNYIYINDAFGQQAGSITATGASSYAGQKLLIDSGAVELNAGAGDVYISAGWGGAGTSIQVTNRGLVQVAGNLIPSGSGVYSLGASSFKWSDVYASNGTIVTSDREKKEDISYDLDAYGAFFDALQPVSYRLKDGQSGRTHLGLIAQDVEKAMKDCGLTDMDFAGLIRSPREDGGYDYALRYGEFIPMLIYEYQMLSAEVEKLKRRLAA